MATPIFDPEAVLASFKAQFAAVDQQYRALTERHHGLQQVIAGLEILLQQGALPIPQKQVEHPTRAPVGRHLDLVTNVLSALRFTGRPMNAVEVQRVIEEGGMYAKRDTIYKALRRCVDIGLAVSKNQRFSLTELGAG